MNELRLNLDINNLDALRENIDNIDLKILKLIKIRIEQILEDDKVKTDAKIKELIKLRFEQVLYVGEYKKERNLPPLQPDRWKKVIESKRQSAIELWLDPDIIEQIWNIFHKNALELEHSITDKETETA